MKPLTKKLLEELMELDDKFTSKERLLIIEHILKSQEDTKTLVICARNCAHFAVEYYRSDEIIKRLKKRIGELEDFRDHAPQYEGSGTVEVNKRLLIQLQEIMGEKK